MKDLNETGAMLDALEDIGEDFIDDDMVMEQLTDELEMYDVPYFNIVVSKYSGSRMPNHSKCIQLLKTGEKIRISDHYPIYNMDEDTHYINVNHKYSLRLYKEILERVRNND